MTAQLKAVESPWRFDYVEVTRKPNVMRARSPLKNGTGKIVGLDNRVNTLENSRNWNKCIDEWRSLGKQFDVSAMPKIGMFKLGMLDIDEDIQRQLDATHCSKIANPETFQEELLQCAICILTSNNKLESIDTQHTVSVIAGLISAGLVEGVSDWRDFEVPVLYVETDNKAFARRAFSILNGKGKKKQSRYQELRNAIFCVRLDGDTSDPDEVFKEKKVSIAEKHDCYPVEVGTNPLPGTFTHIISFNSLDLETTEIVCNWHNTYFHTEPVDSSVFVMFRDMVKEFKAAKIDFSEQLMLELAGMIQSIFANPAEYKATVERAHNSWGKAVYGYDIPWSDDAEACMLLQLYKRLGGTENVPRTMLDRYSASGNNPGIIDFIDEDIQGLFV